MIGLTLLIVSPNYPWYRSCFYVHRPEPQWDPVGVVLALDFIYMVPTLAPFG